MRLLICGDRNWTDDIMIRKPLEMLRVAPPPGLTIIVGRARGADTIAETIALEMGFAVDPYPAEWEKHGKMAGPIRNRQMLVEGLAQVVWAFHDDLAQSKGTRNMVLQARLVPIPVWWYTHRFDSPKEITSVTEHHVYFRDDKQGVLF